MKNSGILCHFSSLPSSYGIGDFGPNAYHFIDELSKSGQKYWQVLPIGNPDYTGCPYATDSAFGISELLISPEKLIQDFNLEPDFFNEFKILDSYSEGKINYEQVRKNKDLLFKKFFNCFTTTPEFHDFIQSENYWLESYCLFRTFQETNRTSWLEWENSKTPKELKLDQKDIFNFHLLKQFLASKQLLDLKNYANKKNISFIGDLPIFVSYESMDVWISPEEFLLDSNTLKMNFETGAAPDAFSESGQKWGTPIYDWKVQSQNQFSWWQKRFSYLKIYFDVVRVDHFRGFCATWISSVEEKNAKNGFWYQGPGKILFLNMKDLPQIIAEDLGMITSDVESLRDGLVFKTVFFRARLY